MYIHRSWKSRRDVIEVHKHILVSCKATYGGPFSCSVAHYISHYVFTHIWPTLCTCWGVIYHFSIHTCSFSSYWSSLYSSISPSCPPSHTHTPYHSICLPVSQAARLIIPPVYLTETTLLPRLPQPLCTRLPGDWSPWRWSRILKAPPRLPLLLLLPSIKKSSRPPPPCFLHSVVVLPSLLATMLVEKHGDL